MDQNPSSSRADRKTIEKNRRNEMKALYSKLNSLIPRQSQPREMVSVPDQLEGATKYIKMQQAKLEKMKQKRNCLVWSKGGANNLPNIDVRVTGSGPALEVVLITPLNSHFIFTRIIRLLHEEGAEVVAATFSQLDNIVFHTIHSEIRDQSAQNHGAARISERLKKFAYE